MEDGELLRAAARADVEVAQHIAKLCWLVVDQMGVERAAELMVGVDGQRRRKVNRSSVVVGEDLSTRDGKVVKVSAKKNTCIRTDQKSCEKSCEGTEMASASPPRCFSATFFFTRFMTMLLISKRPSDRKFS